MAACDGRRASDHKRPCPREAKWEVDFGLERPSLLCDYHKGNIDAFPSLYAGVIVKSLRPAQSAVADH